MEGADGTLLHHFRQQSKAHGFPCEAGLRPEAMGCVGRVFRSGEVRLWGCICHIAAPAVPKSALQDKSVGHIVYAPLHHITTGSQWARQSAGPSGTAHRKYVETCLRSSGGQADFYQDVQAVPHGSYQRAAAAAGCGVRATLLVPLFDAAGRGAGPAAWAGGAVHAIIDRPFAVLELAVAQANPYGALGLYMWMRDRLSVRGPSLQLGVWSRRAWVHQVPKRGCI